MCKLASFRELNNLELINSTYSGSLAYAHSKFLGDKISSEALGSVMLVGSIVTNSIGWAD